MDLKINWKRIFVIFQLITILTTMSVGILFISIIPQYGTQNFLEFIFAICLFSMPLIGCIDFVISMKANQKRWIQWVCLIEALILIFFFIAILSSLIFGIST